MFVAIATRTMQGAKQVVVDDGYQVRTSRRDRLTALSLEWERKRKEQLDRERVLKEQARADIQKWKRKHRRTRFVVKEHRTPHRDMIARVAAWHGVSAEEILNTNIRRKIVVEARRDAIVAVWRNCLIEGHKPTLPGMGRVFNSDHTSILYALRKRGAR